MKRAEVLEHKLDGMAVSSSGYSASHFAGSAERVRKVPLAEDPAIGMWEDREDMKDSSAWVRRQREQWSKRLMPEE